MFEIKVPEFGESIQEVQVASWLKKPGDWIDKDEDIVELESAETPGDEGFHELGLSDGADVAESKSVPVLVFDDVMEVEGIA